MKTLAVSLLTVLLVYASGFNLAYAQADSFTLKEARENTPFVVKRCGHQARVEYAKQHNPQFEQNRAALEAYTQTYSRTAASQKTQAVLTVPVVVHVLYRNATQNISDAQIQSQIDVLNEDFQRLNADTGSTPSAFQSVAANTEIEFCLASTDPDGMVTMGITRTSTTVSEIGNGNFYSTSAGGKDAWNPNQYLNIWVCEIESAGDLLGFATPPGTSGPDDDGVVIDYRYFGTIGTVSAPLHLGRTGTHEVGHYLNLEHIWGIYGGCGDDDLVGDTPDQEYDNYGCPGSASSCGSADMFMNYMDYTDDGCMNIFTLGQKNRMRAALEGARAGLLTSPGCALSSAIGDEIDLSNRVNVYPNPFADQATLELSFDTPVEVEVTIYNLIGKRIYTRSLIAGNTQLELDFVGFTPGLYIVAVETATARYTAKVVKR